MPRDSGSSNPPGRLVLGWLHSSAQDRTEALQNQVPAAGSEVVLLGKSLAAPSTEGEEQQGKQRGTGVQRVLMTQEEFGEQH